MLSADGRDRASSGQRSAAVPASSSHLWAVVLVLLLAAAMRILGAGHAPFWSDEAWNIWAADNGVAVMLDRLAANHHPPSFFLGLSAWQGIAGDTRLALRFVSIAAGMVAVALVYRTGRENFGVTAGICAALVFAVFEQTVYYGQSVRHYAWLLTAQALALWLFLRALRRPTWRRFAAYGVSVAFVAYTMYIGLLAIAAQAVVGLFVWRAPPRLKARLLAAYAGAFAVFAPWLAFALGGVLQKVERGVITGYHNSIPSTLDGVAQMTDIVLGGQAALGIALVALVCLRLTSGEGVQHDAAGEQPTARFDLPLSTVLLSGVGVFALMIVVNIRIGIVGERTLSFLAPAVALTLGVGLASLQPRLRHLLTAALVAWAVLTPQHIVPRLNSDLAAQTVARGYSPGDLVVLETGFDDIAFAYEMDIALPEVDRRVFVTFAEYYFDSDAAMGEALDGELAASDRVWLVYWNVPPRMHDRLTAAGFERTSVEAVPVGIDDPLYLRFPFIEIGRYVRPRDDATPLDFGGELRLLDTVAPARVPQGATFSVDLAWRPLGPLGLDYTTALFVLDEAGATRLEHFGPDVLNPTSGWPAGRTVIDRHDLTLPPELPLGRYTLYAVVYWYQTVDEPLRVGGERGATIASFEVVPPP